jgi:NAD(P)-dependent dehydrogenase (short-subunit alcohol dehydrogenase family)
MSGRLQDKVSVVTGAGSGIGAAIVQAFHREGAKVVAVDISGQQDEVAASVGHGCISVHADVSRGEDVRQMLAAATDEFGALDVLVNNAGIEGPLASTAEYSEDDFDRVWAVNCRGVFLGMRYGVPLLLKRGGGSIINTASMASLVALPGSSAYCAAKGGVLMLTKTAAAEYAKENIRVNAILPGLIRTAITEGLPQEMIQGVVSATPQGRFADPMEVANLAVFLASDEAPFITGSGMVIDGGYTLL